MVLQFYQTALAAVCKVGEWGKLDEALQTVHTESFIRLPCPAPFKPTSQFGTKLLFMHYLCAVGTRQGVQLGPQSQLSGNTKGEDITK